MLKHANSLFDRDPPVVAVPEWVRRTMRFLARNRLILLPLFVAAVVVAAVGALLSRPVYEVTATITLNPDPLSSREDKTFGRPRPEQMARPQMVLLESESVVRKAIETVGVERLFPRLAAKWARSNQLPTDDATAKPSRRLFGERLSPRDEVFVATRAAIQVRSEQNTELIRIFFRHENPALAVEFTNAWLQAFTERYFQIYSSAAAVSVLWDQQKRSSEIFEHASAALAKFSAESQIFLVADQRKLLLERHNNVATALNVTKGLIADKQSQADTIPQQLAQMKPIGRLSQVTDLVKNQLDGAVAAGRAGANVPNLANDPPLLLVRVYQETVATLVKLQTELAGLRTLVKHQQESLGLIDTELNALSRREAEFERLRLEVNQARQNAEQYMKRANDEEFYQELNSRKLSSVQVLQAPTMPFIPIWPRPMVIVVAALLMCAAAFVLSELLRAHVPTAEPDMDDVRIAGADEPKPLLAPVATPVAIAAE